MSGLTSRRLVLAVLSMAVLLPRAVAAQADEVLRWNRIARDAAAAADVGPSTRFGGVAIMHLAIHDALNATDRRFAPYRFSGPVNPAASANAAIAAAAHATLVALLPKGTPAFDTARREALAAIPEGTSKALGLKMGAEAAAAVLAARANDGSGRVVPYVPGTAPGAYRPTPPDFTPAFAMEWALVAPFALSSAAQFRPAPPPAVGSPQARADMEEVRAIGAQTSRTRSAEQSEIARFWYEGSDQGWNRIAREAAAAHRLDAWESARLLALVNVAIADSIIGGVEAKYHYNYWRPVTAIREAGETEWLSDLETPAVPDYPSTHTVQGAAVAAVLSRFFETDFVTFSMTSGDPYPGITRRFWSFSQAARENGASRVLAGIHFTSAVQAGYEQGDRIGAWAFEHLLRPSPARQPLPSFKQP
ncbi:MAG TPA: vanadium-dependent haloperoxidase [Vicinamibacterales bacterium]